MFQCRLAASGTIHEESGTLCITLDIIRYTLRYSEAQTMGISSGLQGWTSGLSQIVLPTIVFALLKTCYGLTNFVETTCFGRDF